MNKEYTIINARLPRDNNKTRYLYILQEFANSLNDKYVSVQYGKQDIRGAYSITVFYDNHTCNGIKYFNTFKELLAFCEGVIFARENYAKQLKDVRM